LLHAMLPQTTDNALRLPLTADCVLPNAYRLGPCGQPPRAPMWTTPRVNNSLRTFDARLRNRTNSRKGTTHRRNVGKKASAVGRRTERIRRTLLNCTRADLRKHPGRAGLESGLSSRLGNLTWQKNECVPLFKAARQGISASKRERAAFLSWQSGAAAELNHISRHLGGRFEYDC
jgi:hypothetical protein